MILVFLTMDVSLQVYCTIYIFIRVSIYVCIVVVPISFKINK